MRKFIEHIENVMTWWMLIVNAVLYRDRFKFCVNV